jgi:hypothetical protein
MFTLLATALYTIVGFTLLNNIAEVFIESKRLEKQGKTPLTLKSIATVIVASISELIFVFLILLVERLVITDKLLGTNVYVASLAFIIPFLLRNLGSYLTAWGMWSIFVRLDKKKAIQKIKADQQAEKVKQ